ncbi:enoyl-CoA hydratase-related protein [Pseudofrankia inefficax]|uniref:Enoyl-CoA hydratase/isomerase n=1 Tax=Pseudofrankia inefficax (strain DSM 45817 / CECT 9037 / DDB 130130 / EuI1c) TaxID=298654 RepID=E3IU45_PSEI1|nr:enoyl-CoA hydratase-related protein [Pseudofrankia inefficax]ADP81238.1 Enoyl-CoA hydratase/isomerase [Pseudofrankia inefficax]
MRTGSIAVETDGPIAQLVIDKPTAANALTPDDVLALVAAYEELDAAGAAKVIVLSGRGRGFCAGHDLRRPGAVEGSAGGPEPSGAAAGAQAGSAGEPESGVLDDWRGLRRSSRALLRMRDGDTPVLARVHGYCLGSGVDLMLMCDLAVATTTCRFSHPAIRAAGGTPNAMAYPSWIGTARTKEFLWVTPELTGIEAAAWGMVNRAVLPEELDDTVGEWAARIASLPKDNITIQRQHLRRIQDLAGFRQAIELGADLDTLAHTSSATSAWRSVIAEDGLPEAIRRRDQAFRHPRGG